MRERDTLDRGSFPIEARPVLRVAAAMAGLALAGYAAVAVIVLVLAGVP